MLFLFFFFLMIRRPPRSTLFPYTTALPICGDVQGSGNIEYSIPIVGPVTARLFFDGGTEGVVRRDGLRLDATGFSDLVSKFRNAGLTNRLPIARGSNFRLRGSTGIEFSVQLPIVQAPFRVYYAYNIHRLHESISAQQPFIDQSEINFLKDPSTFPDPTIYPLQIAPQLNFLANNPGRLNYFEPKTTFRFTVSRTF